MSAETATALNPAVSAARLRPSVVPSRVAYHHPITNYERLQAELAAEQQADHMPAHRGRFGFPETRHGGPHPGDIAYWVACVGGAGMLLLCAIH